MRKSESSTIARNITLGFAFMQDEMALASRAGMFHQRSIPIMRSQLLTTAALLALGASTLTPLPAVAQDLILPDEAPGVDASPTQTQQGAPDEILKPRKRRDAETRSQGRDETRAAAEDKSDAVRKKKRPDIAGQSDEATTTDRRKERSAETAQPGQSTASDEQQGDAAIRKRKLDADKAQSQDQGSKPDQAQQRTTAEKPRDQQNDASKPDQAQQRTTAEKPRDQQNDATSPTHRLPADANANTNIQMPRGGNEARSADATGNAEVNVRGRVNIAREAAPRIHRELLRSGNRTDVSIDYTVGRPISDRVRLAPLPPEIIDESPQLRGYEYTVVEDEVVVVDPRTREVVEVIGNDSGSVGRSGGYAEETQTGTVRQGGGREVTTLEGRAPAPGGKLPQLTLSASDREFIRDEVLRLRNAAMLNITTGEQIPDQVPIQPIPDEIASQVPAIQQFDYFVTNERVVLVDPNSRSIVDVIQ
jgi:hypothetical protein